MKTQISRLRSFIRKSINENFWRPIKPSAQTHLDAGLTSLDAAIESFHKAMDADPIFFEKTTMLQHIKELEDVYDGVSTLSPNSTSQWD